MSKLALRCCRLISPVGTVLCGRPKSGPWSRSTAATPTTRWRMPSPAFRWPKNTVQATEQAPLLCAGLIGYRALRLAGGRWRRLRRTVAFRSPCVGGRSPIRLPLVCSSVNGMAGCLDQVVGLPEITSRSFTPPAGGGELEGLLKGAGICDLNVSNPVGQTGMAQGAADAFNSRFGLYKNGAEVHKAPMRHPIHELRLYQRCDNARVDTFLARRVQCPWRLLVEAQCQRAVWKSQYGGRECSDRAEYFEFIQACPSLGSCGAWR